MTKSCHRLRVLASSRRLRCDTREGVAEDHTLVADHLAGLSSSIRTNDVFSIFIHDIIQFWIDWTLTFQTKLEAVIYISYFTCYIKKCCAFYVLRWIIPVMTRVKCQGVKHRTTRNNICPIHPPHTSFAWQSYLKNDEIFSTASRAAVYVSRVKFSSTDQLLWATTVGGDLTFS